MNSLSLLLYAADVLPSLAVLGTILATLFSIVLVITTIITWSVEPKDMSEGFRNEQQRLRKTLFYLAAIGYFFGTFIPEPSTFYLIAASEGAQVAMSNPEAQEMFGSVKEIIQLKLDQVVAELKEPITK